MIDLSWLPPHKASLTITHNEHTSNYETVEEYLRRADDRLEFPSLEARQACIDANEIWELQWYPETPVGFCAIAAPTFDALVEYTRSCNDD